VQSLTMVQEEASSNVTREREHAPAPEQARAGDPATLQCDGEQRQAPDEPSQESKKEARPRHWLGGRADSGYRPKEHQLAIYRS
jgi:hypothetical protein